MPERCALSAALLVLPPTGLLLRLVGYRRLRGLMTRLAPLAAPPIDAGPALARSDWAVRVADSRLPLSPTCLSRSLTLWLLLRFQGVESELCLGVRRGLDDLDAHAWVEHQGRAVNDTTDASHPYATIHTTASSP